MQRPAHAPACHLALHARARAQQHAFLCTRACAPPGVQAGQEGRPQPQRGHRLRRDQEGHHAHGRLPPLRRGQGGLPDDQGAAIPTIQQKAFPGYSIAWRAARRPVLLALCPVCAWMRPGRTPTPASQQCMHGCNHLWLGAPHAQPPVRTVPQQRLAFHQRAATPVLRADLFHATLPCIVHARAALCALWRRGNAPCTPLRRAQRLPRLCLLLLACRALCRAPRSAPSRCGARC